MIDTGARTELDSSYPDTFLSCRDLRHSWERLGMYHAYGDIVRVLVCSRCGTDRRDHWAPGGTSVRRRTYDYPDGYQVHGGEAVSAFEVRQEVLNRVVIYDSEDAMQSALFPKRRKARA